MATDWDTCPTCNGTGWWRQDVDRCPTCNGLGVIPVHPPDK